MSTQILSLIATQTQNEAAFDSEVVVLGYRSPGAPPLVADPDLIPEGWQIVTNVQTGPELGQQAFGFRGTSGTLELEAGARGRLALLRHPWSGIVRIEMGEVEHEIDLYSPNSHVVFVDLPSGEVIPATAELLKRIEVLPMSRQPPQIEASDAPAREGELVIRPTGTASVRSHGQDVVVLQIEPLGYGFSADLSVYLGRGQTWQPMQDVGISNHVWRGGIRAKEGEIRLACEPNGRIFLLRHGSAGIVELSYGATSVRIDLFAPTNSLLELRVGDLAQLAEHSAAGIPSEKVRAKASFSGSTSRRERFAQLTAGFDRSKPVALYVPRWHGVAMSTKTLFEQSLPVPEGHDTHPDDITRGDIEEYAQIIVDSGFTHIVISGGDLFNLQIIDAAMRLAPKLRVDMLWHSNFLQMGEAHDWNLLRHWLAALRDGTVTRIGVVKEGLERWFRQLGIDSTFIPNVVPFDTEVVRATEVDDVVGIWLSGSSSYRKLPHAMLLALKSVPGVTLVGSGLDPQSQRMIQDLRLPFREISVKPLPQARLHARMRQTGLSLYVTISECSPMLPLESFALGVPCLVGPSSHLFQRSERLKEALVVRHPQSPIEIADKIGSALAQREELFDAYLKYYADEMQLAKEGVVRLLS